MQEMPISMFIEVCSPPTLFSFLEETLPAHKKELANVQPQLLDASISALQKINAIKRACGEEFYFIFEKNSADVREIIDLDLNAPILYNILEEAQIDFPKDLSFEDLAVWVRIYYPRIWAILKARSFRRTSSRKVHDYMLSTSLFEFSNYANPDAIAEFEAVTSQMCKRLGIGKYTKYIFDRVSDGISRSILFLSPVPLYVMTCNHAADFKIKLDENAIKVVFVYNEHTHVLSIIGDVSEATARLNLAKAWAHAFIGGFCEGSRPPKHYALERFLTLPTTLSPERPLIHRICLSEITLCVNTTSTITIGTHEKSAKIDKEILSQQLALFKGNFDVTHVVLTVFLKHKVSRVRKFIVSLSKRSLACGAAGDFEEIRSEIKKVLEDYHVTSNRL